MPEMTMRPEQVRILSEMERLVAAGARNIIVVAPTGVGKSLVAKAVASVAGPAWIVTSTKHLQDQYAADFRDVRTIKGMTNFPCLQLMGKTDVRGERHAMEKGLTCDKGQCTIMAGKKVVGTCPHKEVLKPNGLVSPGTRPCHYYKQRNAGMQAAQTVLNYALYFSLIAEQSSLDRPAVVFDEAHTIEDEAVRFVGLDVRASYFTDTGLDPTAYDMEHMDSVLDMLMDLRQEYGKRLSVSPDEYSSADRIMRYKTMDRRYDIVTGAAAKIRADPHNFVLQDPQWGTDGKFKGLSVSPLDMSKMLPDMLGSGINVFMSATIRPDIFAKAVGLDGWKSIEIDRSPFPAASRGIKYLDVARLTSKSPPEDEVRVAREIDRLISKHRGERGLILTSSKARCRRLLSRLGRESASRVKMAHSENEGGETIKEIMVRHRASPDSILLSSSLWQGVDLKDHLSRFQIVEKCPWPYLGDRRVEALAKADWNWYSYQTVVKLLQGFGRSVRSTEDWAVTYVMDSAVRGLLRRCRHMVPLAYHDTVFA